MDSATNPSIPTFTPAHFDETDYRALQRLAVLERNVLLEIVCDRAIEGSEAAQWACCDELQKRWMIETYG